MNTRTPLGAKKVAESFAMAIMPSLKRVQVLVNPPAAQSPPSPT